MPRVRVTRDQLYAEVWAEPATKVAARYGISSTALAKICRKLGVPTPDRGYWALHAVGKAPVTPKLAPPSRGTVLAHDIVQRPPSAVANTTSTTGLEIEVPETLTSPHSLTTRLAAHLRSELRGKNRGAVHPAAQHECLDVQASVLTLDRVLVLVDTLIRALEARGHAVEVVSRSASREYYRSQETGSITQMVIHGQRVTFHIDELIDRVPTLDGRIQPQSALDAASGRVMEIRPSGRLQFTIDTYGGEGERRTWRDGRSQRLEKCLGSIIESAERIAAWCNARDDEHRRREVEARRRRHQDALLADCQKRADTLHDVQRILSFLDAVVVEDPQAGDPTTTHGAVLAFVRAQMEAHRQLALNIRGLNLDP